MRIKDQHAGLLLIYLSGTRCGIIQSETELPGQSKYMGELDRSPLTDPEVAGPGHPMLLRIHRQTGLIPRSYLQAPPDRQPGQVCRKGSEVI